MTDTAHLAESQSVFITYPFLSSTVKRSPCEGGGELVLGNIAVQYVSPITSLVTKVLALNVSCWGGQQRVGKINSYVNVHTLM